VPTRAIVLVGMMGSGKTTVGKKLASKLQLPFVDTDAEIERREGRSVAEIFAADGEPSFRATESQVLGELLTADAPKVIATGGGAVLDPGNRTLLRQHAIVVWLQAPAGVLAQRVGDDTSRPLLADDPRTTIDRLLVERAPLYREVADHIVEVGRGDRRSVLARVLEAVTVGAGSGAAG
jgi:shikimate kinase